MFPQWPKTLSIFACTYLPLYVLFGEVSDHLSIYKTYALLPNFDSSLHIMNIKIFTRYVIYKYSSTVHSFTLLSSIPVCDVPQWVMSHSEWCPYLCGCWISLKLRFLFKNSLWCLGSCFLEEAFIVLSWCRFFYVPGASCSLVHIF